MSLDQWFTPPSLAEHFLRWCEIREQDTVLEPAAGEGALVLDRSGSFAFEVDEELAGRLRLARPKATVVCADFLTIAPPHKPIADVCVTNPPYSFDGEGVFIRRGLRWANRCCALVRNNAFLGIRRFDKCWSGVRVLRIGYLLHRPKFNGPLGAKTKFTPQYDYVVVDCVSRSAPVERGSDFSDDAKISWLAWK